MKEDYRTIIAFDTDQNGNYMKQEVRVSENSIATFCGSCERLGIDNVCNGLVGASKWQPEVAFHSTGECSWARVDGVLGEMTRDGFAPKDWLSPIMKDILINITPEIKTFVESVEPVKLIQQKQQLETSLGEYIKRFPNNDESWYFAHFFNNWSCHLPDKDYRKHSVSRYREMLKDLGGWDLSRSVVFPNDKGSSDLRSIQTGKEFYATIDASILAEGLNFEEIIRLNGQDKEDVDFAHLHTYTLPAFIRLLALGYSYNDLVR